MDIQLYHKVIDIPNDEDVTSCLKAHFLVTSYPLSCPLCVVFSHTDAMDMIHHAFMSTFLLSSLPAFLPSYFPPLTPPILPPFSSIPQTRAISQPFAYREYRKEKIKQKIEEQRASRVKEKVTTPTTTPTTTPIVTSRRNCQR